MTEIIAELENIVVCHQASNSFCASIFRYPCGRTAHTCGTCLPLYTGDSGDHNVQCIISKYVPKKNLIQIMVAPLNVCSTSSQCNGFQQCIYNQCVIPNQYCPGGNNQSTICNGHGHCTYISYDTGYQVGTCLIGDPLCYPVCQCQLGMFGLSCAMDEITYNSNINLKELLITSLYNQTISHDAEPNTIINWASTSSALAMNYDQLSATSIKLLTAIMTTVLYQVNRLVIPYTQVFTINLF